jgi:hypothetical protein
MLFTRREQGHVERRRHLRRRVGGDDLRCGPDSGRAADEVQQPVELDGLGGVEPEGLGGVDRPDGGNHLSQGFAPRVCQVHGPAPPAAGAGRSLDEPSLLQGRGQLSDALRADQVAPGQLPLPELGIRCERGEYPELCRAQPGSGERAPEPAGDHVMCLDQRPRGQLRDHGGGPLVLVGRHIGS